MKLFPRLAAAFALLVLAAVPAGAAGSAASGPIPAPAAYPERVLGKADAPITMVDYSSLTCPHCATFHTTVLPQIKKDFIDTGKVKLVYRDFPLDRLALGAAVVARCVPEGSFFPLLDMLYKGQEKWTRASNPLDAIQGYGRLAGLTPDAMDACFKDQPLVDAIQQVRENANKAHNITSTPSFVINGTLHSGAQGYDYFAKVFNELEGR